MLADGAAGQSCVPFLPPTSAAEVAAAGAENPNLVEKVVETDIAVGDDGNGSALVMVVYFNDKENAQGRVGYSFRDQNGQWNPTGGVVPTGATIPNSVLAADGSSYTVPDMNDASVAYDASNHSFICAAFGNRPDTGFGVRSMVAINHFHTATKTWDQQWTEVSVRAPGSTASRDKPFLVAGEPDEFYVVWWGGIGINQGYGLVRTTDGGATWTQILPITVGGNPVLGHFAMQPATASGSDLFLVYADTSTHFQVLRGVDQPGGGMIFSYLENNSVPIGIDLTTDLQSVSHNLPCLAPGNKSTLQVALDPSNANRLYLAYNDSANTAVADINTFVRTLDKRGSNWYVGPRTKIHGNAAPSGCSPTDDDSDQFLPAITVDEGGRVHVLYYEDRYYCQADSDEDGFYIGPERFDVSYAVSCDGAQTWTNIRMLPDPVPGDPDPAFLDYQWGPLIAAGPKEYNGAAYWFDGTTTHVWFSFTGTSFLDPDDQKNVIWALPIQW